MFYSFVHTVSDTEVVSAPKRIDMDLTAGVIHQVDIVFENGCDNEAKVQIFQGGHQLWPSNRGSWLAGNATIVSFREFHELRPGKNDLHALVWGDGIIDDVQVIIQVGVLPKAILQPLSFDELLAAATGM